MFDTKAMAAATAEVMRTLVEREMSPVLAKLAELEADIESLKHGHQTKGTLRYRGTYAAGAEYVAGDTVTFGGSLWHCNEVTAEKPGNGAAAWTLAVKRGRDGKDAGHAATGKP